MQMKENNESICCKRLAITKEIDAKGSCRSGLCQWEHITNINNEVINLIPDKLVVEWIIVRM